MEMKFDALMREYEKVTSSGLIGKEADCTELRRLAEECNKGSKIFDFNVKGTDAELLKSIKRMIDFTMAK